MRTLYANCLFTDCALTPDGDVWWEVMTNPPPPQLEDWHGERCEGTAKAVEPAIGNLPDREVLDLSGLEIAAEDLQELLSVDVERWLAEAESMREFYGQFGARLPQALRDEIDDLQRRLEAARG
jgi:GTP-dependent phosphoenolpyruvate carboxykinase